MSENMLVQAHVRGWKGEHESSFVWPENFDCPSRILVTVSHSQDMLPHLQQISDILDPVRAVL